MATFSFPSRGDNGLSVANWEDLFNGTDGVINNFNGAAWPLSIVTNATIARLGAGTVRVNGYVLVNNSDLDLTIPPAAGTYYIAACYDPNLNVAQVDGNANPLGPVRIVIDSTLSTAGGKAYTLMFRLVRSISAGAVTTNSWMPSVGNVFSVNTMPPAKLTDPEGALTGWDHPVGSQCLARDTGEWYDKVPSGGSTYWRPRSIQGPFPFPNNSPLVAANSNEPARYYFTDNGTVCHLEGTLKRSSGALLSSTGVDVTLGTMPNNALPAIQGRWSCVAKMPSKWNNVQVTIQANGTVVMYDPSGFEVSWVDLSGISYRVK